MDTKKSIMFWMIVGSVVGGYIPALWDSGIFSLSSVLFSALGGFTGIWFGYRLGS